MAAELTPLVRAALQAAPMAMVMKVLAAVTQYDRYQASHGIGAAAQLVADAATATGLSQVHVDYHLADGRDARWWTFQAPTSWTPLRARLSVTAAGGECMRIDHATQPFSIATHSAPTPRSGIHTRLVRQTGARTGHTGALVLLDGVGATFSAVCAELERDGAAGFVTAAGAGVARFELPPTGSLFGFSVTAAQFAQCCRWSDAGAHAHAEVDIDRSAPMPVVSAVLQGTCPGEVWLTAHLCHPRPGANDNASGVAALLGIAATLRALGIPAGTASKTVRFAWCPEFCGTAALLHQRMAACGAAGHPDAVINLDMVGESQQQCGAPFVLELPPATHACLLGPLAESVVAEVFLQTAQHGGTWRTTPFLGYSDHALFAGQHNGCPAIQLTHWPDRYNHSADDTIDKVCPHEMLRSVAAGTVLTQLLRCDSLLPRGARQHVLAQAQTRVDNQAHTRWTRAQRRYSDRQFAAMRAALDQPLAQRFRGAAARPGHPRACWDGPLNLRAMAAALPAARRAQLAQIIDADKSTLALLANFAVRADGRHRRDQIIDATSHALHRQLDRPRCDWLFDTLLLSGWISLF